MTTFSVLFFQDNCYSVDLSHIFLMLLGDFPFLYITGACTVAYFGFKAFKLFAQLCKESLWSRPVDFKQYGDWVVVTGGSDGIGKAIATEFAKCGMHVCILARTKSKLEDVEQHIKSEYHVNVKTIVVDFRDDDDIYDQIKEDLEGLNVAVLVNNVGMAYLRPSAHLDIPDHEKYSTDTINVNVKSMIKLTGIILPRMVSNKGGIVVNISSVIGSRNSPLFAVYGATKSFMITFTEALRQEYQQSGIIFQCIAPAITATPAVAATTKSNFMIPTPEKFGKYAIKAVGKSAYTNTGFFWHNAFQIILCALPDSIFLKGMASEMEKAVIVTNKDFAAQ